jgi:hypothetical protein
MTARNHAGMTTKLPAARQRHRSTKVRGIVVMAVLLVVYAASLVAEPIPAGIQEARPKTPVLLRPAIKSHLHGCRSPLILDVSTDTPAVSGFASGRTSVTFLRASRRREFPAGPLDSGGWVFSEPWRYRPGDSPGWSAPELDDSSWGLAAGGGGQATGFGNGGMRRMTRAPQPGGRQAAGGRRPDSGTGVCDE